MTNKIEAIFLDIDGTTVSMVSHAIPESTIKALEMARANGIKIFIATGRTKTLINNLSELQERGLIDGYITMNGAYCFIGDRVLHRSVIPHSEVLSIAHQAERVQCSCVFNGEHSSLLYQPTELFKEIFYDLLKVSPIEVASSLEQAMGEPILQMSPFFTQEQEDEIIQELPNCEVGRWHPTFSDISAKGNTKESGIEIIAQEFGFSRDNIICFGDGGNDIGMLRYAHIGVAMGNASDEVKSCADYVTSSVDEDGIYRALEHFEVI